MTSQEEQTHDEKERSGDQKIRFMEEALLSYIADNKESWEDLKHIARTRLQGYRSVTDDNRKGDNEEE